MNRQTEKKWYVRTKKADFREIAARFRIDPVTARILTNRGITGERELRLFLEGGLRDLYDESLLPDAETGAEAVLAKIRERKKIRIVGDYDIDGVCAAFILYDGLKKIGAQIDYRIPERIRDGYGISMRIVEEAVLDGVDTLITCDNGIAASEELKKAKQNGMTVILTDHHEIRKDENGREVFPPADYVITAQRKDSGYRTEEICGAVTAWKFLHCIFRKAGVGDEVWLSYLEFAGIATIGDVMSLTGENRIIAREGLAAISRGPVNCGLRALISACGLSGLPVSCYHVGFVLGPCINAGGRLETAEKAMRLFLAEDELSAQTYAQELRELNDSRKDMTQKGVEQAARIAGEDFPDDRILVICLKDLHESMAGIVAGRLKELFGKPAFVLTGSAGREKTEDGTEVMVLKGSGRSVEAWNMYEGLKQAEDLLVRFGGHPMAAGLSLREDRLGEFRRRLNEECALTAEELAPKFWIDLPMPLSYVSAELVREFERLEPYGNGNPKPLFAEKNIRPVNLKVIGRNRNGLKMDLYTSDGYRFSGLMFGNADELRERLEGRRSVNIVYHPQLNRYMGTETVQFLIEDFF